MQQRVEILKLLYRDARVLILDEPTAVLTPAEKEGLFATLRSLRAEGRSVVIVTHKLHEIMAVADRVSVMRIRPSGRHAGGVARPPSETLPGAWSGATWFCASTSPSARPGPVVLQVKEPDVCGTKRAGPSCAGLISTLRAGEIFGIAGVDGNGQSELADAVSGSAAFPREAPSSSSGQTITSSRDGRRGGPLVSASFQPTAAAPARSRRCLSPTMACSAACGPMHAAGWRDARPSRHRKAGEGDRRSFRRPHAEHCLAGRKTLRRQSAEAHFGPRIAWRSGGA